jgi:hypothetical protein
LSTFHNNLQGLLTDAFELKSLPDYREILKQHGIDVGEMTDEELQKLIKELQNGTSN